MLKNQSNAALQTQWWTIEGVLCCTGKAKETFRARKVLRFIEQHSCKIKRIKIEGFV